MCSSESSATWTVPVTLEGGTRLKRTMVEVRMRLAAGGWLVTQRYGPVCRWRWFWRESKADRFFDSAIDAAERFVDTLSPGLQAQVRSHKLRQPQPRHG